MEKMQKRGENLTTKRRKEKESLSSLGPNSVLPRGGFCQRPLQVKTGRRTFLGDQQKDGGGERRKGREGGEMRGGVFHLERERQKSDVLQNC